MILLDIPVRFRNCILLEGPAADGGALSSAGVTGRALGGHESSFQISMKSIRLI